MQNMSYLHKKDNRKQQFALAAAGAVVIGVAGYLVYRNWQQKSEAASCNSCCGSETKQPFESAKDIKTFVKDAYSGVVRDFSLVKLLGRDKKKGKNDGRVQRVRCFSCEPNAGLFVRRDTLQHTRDRNDECLDQTAIEEKLDDEIRSRAVGSREESLALSVDVPPETIVQVSEAVLQSFQSESHRERYSEEKIRQFVEQAKTYKVVTGEPQITIPNIEDVDTIDEDEKADVIETKVTIGLDVDYDSFNSQTACEALRDFSRAADIPIECLRIECVARGSSIIEIVVDWGRAKARQLAGKTKVTLKLMYENLASDKAKKILNTMGAFMVMCASPTKHAAAPSEAMKNQMTLHAKWNRMYGPGHAYWSGSLSDANARGGHPYYCPSGWKRFSVHVQGLSDDKFAAKFSNWAIAYHGTKFNFGASILLSGFIPAGCTALGKGLYVTPSIIYAAHPRYAEVKEIESDQRHHFSGGRFVQFVLECRVDPQYIETIGPETLSVISSGNKFRVDPNFMNTKLEWVVSKRNFYSFSDPNSCVVCSGIMIRVTDVHPQYLEETGWWSCSNRGTIETRHVSILSDRVG